MINGATYIQNPRQCPSCKAAQEPKADSVTNPVTRECQCGFQWRNFFRGNKLAGYDLVRGVSK